MLVPCLRPDLASMEANVVAHHPLPPRQERRVTAAEQAATVRKAIEYGGAWESAHVGNTKPYDDALAALDALVARCDFLGEQLDRQTTNAAIYYERVQQLEQERDEWKREADLSKWPKEAAHEYHRMKVDLPAAERRVQQLETALRDEGRTDEWGKPLDLEALRQLLDAAPPGSDWWFDGRDLFYKPQGTNLDQIIVPFPETFHPDQAVARATGFLIAAAINLLRAHVARAALEGGNE
jgi:hypothetical protein